MANCGGVICGWRGFQYIFWATSILLLESIGAQSVSQPGHHLSPDHSSHHNLANGKPLETEAEQRSSQTPSNSQHSSVDTAEADGDESPPIQAPPTTTPTQAPTTGLPVEEPPLLEPPLSDEEGNLDKQDVLGRDGQMQGRSVESGNKEEEEGASEGGGKGQEEEGRGLEEGEKTEERVEEKKADESGESEMDESRSGSGSSNLDQSSAASGEGGTPDGVQENGNDRTATDASGGDTGKGGRQEEEELEETLGSSPSGVVEGSAAEEQDNRTGGEEMVDKDGRDAEKERRSHEGSVIGEVSPESEESDSNDSEPELGPDEKMLDDLEESKELRSEGGKDDTCSHDACPDSGSVSSEQNKMESKEGNIEGEKGLQTDQIMEAEEVVGGKVEDEGSKECGELGCVGEHSRDKDEEEDDQVLTFEEFKKKLQEQGGGQVAGQRTPDLGAAGPSANKKTTLTNYASVDCGAKVVEANPEAQNTMAILHENRDLYMINPCKVNISFVVELCEVVSVRTIEIACFELFSSIPKTFRVSTRDSLSEGEWVSQGEFHVPNERIIHSIPLATEEHVYARFIKVEMLAHYGQEHFCPLSLLRVLGASMMEVYEESQHKPRPPLGAVPTPVTLPPSEGFGQDDILTDTGESSSEDNGTLLAAAKDAVMSVLNRPLSLLNKMNGLMKPEQRKPLEEQPDQPPKSGKSDHSGEGAPSKGDKIAASDDEHSQGTAEGGKSGEEEDKGSQPADDAKRNLNSDGGQHCTEGSPSCPDSQAALKQDEELSSAGISSVGREGASVSQQLSISQQDQSLLVSSLPTAADTGLTSLTATGGVASGQPGSTLNPTQTISTLSAETAIHPTPAGTSDPAPDPESISLGPDLGPDLGPAQADLDSLSVLDPEADERGRENGGKNGRGSLEDKRSEDDEKRTGEGKVDAESRSDHIKTSVDNAAENSHSEGGVSSAESVSHVMVDRTDASTTSHSTSTIASHSTPTSMGTSIHPEASSTLDIKLRTVVSTTGNGDSQPEHATVTPTLLSPTPSILSAPKDSLPNQPLTSNTTADCSGNLSLASSVPDPKSKNNPVPNSNSSALNSSCTSNTTTSTACNANGSSSENGSLTSSKSDSHLLDGVKNSNESQSALIHNQNDTVHQNTSQLDTNATQNGNQTSNGHHSGTEYKGLPLPVQQKERSVFLRLSNHIEELNSNMTLFSIYLDQISSSLKKNKNRTDETSKLLEKRITILNATMMSLKEEVDCRVENVSEYRQELLEFMEVISAAIHHFSSLRAEFVLQAQVFMILLVAIVGLLTLALLWQCHSQRILHREVRLLKMAVSTHRVESVGGASTSHLSPLCGSSHSNTSVSTYDSSSPRISKHARSSSASRLSDIAAAVTTSNGCGHRGSTVGGAKGNGHGIHNGQHTDLTRQSFNSIYTTLQHLSDNTKEHDWILSTDKKRRKSKGNKKT